MKQDRLTFLSEMRPQTSLDAVWTAEEQKLVPERILADRTRPLKVTDQRRSPSRMRRRARRTCVSNSLALTAHAATPPEAASSTMVGAPWCSATRCR